MTPAHFYFNLFVLLYSMCQFYPQVSAITAPQTQRTKEEKKQLFENSSRGVGKNFLRVPQKISPQFLLAQTVLHVHF